VGLCQSQTFKSGSNGSDGALNLTTPGKITFDPKSFKPPLNPAGDNIYNFTTINIAAGVTVTLTSKNLSGPIYWLAQGAVTINGKLDLSGENGPDDSNITSLRVPAAGGAGGYSGGLGGAFLAGNPSLPTPTSGNGPGGGQAGTAGSESGVDGAFTGSQYLIPLIGGSGGGGGANANVATGPVFGGGGGGGGGAILIASSVSITYGGSIITNGGARGSNQQRFQGGGGSGGAIRLIAPVISDNVAGDSACRPFGSLHGSLQARGPANAVSNNGIIRLEAFDLTNVDIADCVQGGPTVITSTPLNVALPATPPSALKVTSINGMPINANPFKFPDAVINSSGPVTVNVQAQYIPLGIVPKIIVTSESGPTQTVNCSALQGTFQQSTCSASITFLTGGSRGFVKATWTQ
jgi:hypothetical protein